MNLKTTLALLVLVGLGVTAWLIVPPPAPNTVASETLVVLENDLKPEQLTRIEMRTGDRTVVLLRDPDGKWSLPGGWPIREKEVGDLVSLVAGLRTRFVPEHLGEKAPDLAKYGLEKPAATVTAQTRDGKSYRLSLGEANAKPGERFTNPTWLRLDEQREVIRLAPGIIAALDRPADYYQQRRLFPGERVAKSPGSVDKVERLDAKSVTIHDTQEGSTPFTLARDKEEWSLESPVKDLLDPERRNALLEAVPDLWAEEFQPAGNVALARAAAGLAGTSGLLSVYHLSQTLLEAERDPACVATAFVAPCLGGLAQLLPAAVLLKVGKPDKELRLRSPEEWLLIRRGLFGPNQAVRVTRADGKSVTLLIGNKAPTTKTRKVRRPSPDPRIPPFEQDVPEDYRYARLLDNDQLFVIRAEKLKDIFVPFGNLRDARLARFETKDVTRLEIKHDKETIVLVRDGKERWKLQLPGGGPEAGGVNTIPAERGKIDELLTKLAGLEARDADVLDTFDNAKLGFDKPAGTITVTVEEEKDGNKKTRTLQLTIGKHDKDLKKLYVKTEGRSRVDAVEDGFVSLFERPTLAYRGRKLFDFLATEVRQVEVEKGGKKLALVQEKEGKWKLTAPAESDIDSGKGAALAEALGKLEVVEFVNDAPRQEDLDPLYGLGKPELSAVVHYLGGKHTLYLGKQRETKPEYFARLDNSPSVFVVKREIRDLLDKDSLSYLPTQLWQLQPQEIASVRIQKEGGEPYSLERKDALWKITGPFEATALSATVQPFIEELATPNRERYESHGTEDPAGFGLDKPYLKLDLTLQDGKPRELLVGKPVKDSKSRFARLSDAPAIFVVSEALVSSLERPALDLLDLKLASIEPSTLRRVQSVQGEKKLTLERKGEAWDVTEGPGAPFAADANAATMLTVAWLRLQADRWAAYGSKLDLPAYGLDKPAATVTVIEEKPGGEGEPAKKQEHVLDIGKEVEGKPGQRYAKLRTVPGVAVLSADRVKTLLSSHLDYVNRALLKLDPTQVTALVRQQGGASLELSRKDGEWTITKPTEQKGDEKSIQDFADQLAELRAARIAEYPVKDLKAYGLDTPAAVWTLKLTADGKPVEQTIKIGKEASGGERFALAGDGKAVAVLPARLSERLLASPIVFRNRDIVRFSDAEAIQLERGARKATFTRVDGNWKLTAPLDAPADQNDLEDFLNSAARLRADELVAEKPADLKPYGLDKPIARWKFRMGDRDVLDLVVGNLDKEGRRAFAKLAAGDIVFLLDPKLTKRVLGEFRTREVWKSPVDAAGIDSFRVTHGDSTLTLAKGETGGWTVAGKPDAKPVADTVSDTLAAFAGLKLERYAIDRDADLKLYGLDKPEWVLEAETRSGKATLHLGRAEEGSKRLYGRVPDGERKEVFVVSEADVARLTRDVKALSTPLPLKPVIPELKP
jgi:hypothetical protein